MACSNGLESLSWMVNGLDSRKMTGQKQGSQREALRGTFVKESLLKPCLVTQGTLKVIPGN